jgi:hypothetical protein
LLEDLHQSPVDAEGPPLTIRSCLLALSITPHRPRCSRSDGVTKLPRPPPTLLLNYSSLILFEMFNRNNSPSVPSSFGNRPDGGRPSQQGYSNPNQAPPRYDYGHGLAPRHSPGRARDDDVPMTDAYNDPRGYGAPPPAAGRPSQQMAARPPVGGRPGGAVAGGQTWTLHPSKSPNDNFTFGNL